MNIIQFFYLLSAGFLLLHASEDEKTPEGIRLMYCEQELESYTFYCRDISLHPERLQKLFRRFCASYAEMCEVATEDTRVITEEEAIYCKSELESYTFYCNDLAFHPEPLRKSFSKFCSGYREMCNVASKEEPEETVSKLSEVEVVVVEESVAVEESIGTESIEEYCKEEKRSYNFYCTDLSIHSDGLRLAFEEYCNGFLAKCESYNQKSGSEGFNQAVLKESNEALAPQEWEYESESGSEESKASESDMSESKESESEKSESKESAESESKESAESESKESESESSKESEESESESEESEESSSEEQESGSGSEYCQEGKESYDFYCRDISVHPDGVRKAFEKYCSSYQDACQSRESKQSESEESKKSESESEESKLSESEESKESESKESKSKSKSKPKKSKSKSKKSKSKSEKSKSKSKSKSNKSKRKEKPRDLEQEFKECCKNHKLLVDSCKYLCSFDNINRQMMVDAFFRNTCPNGAGRYVIDCASFGNDYTECCKELGVDKHAAGLCMPFCNPTSHAFLDVGVGAAPCMDVFPKISQCFQTG